ncbi:MAG: dihydrofolate synthase [Actinobacteria bacterium]|nr:dihydrofolate synthase [Actinomycetota bacterium]MSW22814.1 dihydrofolate synthase [Actinomycetota bacterium]MSX04266.1 dihydrofolate synthase [Actinomycetota bacterium]MSX84182.1 dihydrofolate synthase [Actinomycetota bacterium]MSY96958.1 dihydrofolate synthase [Actinomycetota bacterium]
MKRWPENKIEPSLDRISALVDALGSPQISFPTVHIGGTNGKTSTSRMVDALFTELEYRTGRFTSPHLESFLERISIKGEAISPAELIATYNDIALYLDLIDSRSDTPISYFEALTALAFVAFAEHPVDIGIIEVGMGGDWDATNVIQSTVSVLMPIGLDHTEYLGETIEEIARTKAGIIKPESHVVLAAQEPEVARILLERVVEKSAIPYREGIEFALLRRDIAVGGQLIAIRGVHGEYSDIYLPLHGAHQAANAAIAVATVEAFVGVKLDEDLVRAAFAGVSSPGRLEILHRDPTVIIDAAHNPHGAKALAETIRSEFDFESIFCVLGILGDKDVKGFLKALEPVVDRLVVTKSESPRALSVAELFALAVEVFGSDRVFKEDDLASAITYAMEQVTLINQVSDGVSAVVITGSVVTAGSARVILKKIGRAVEK